jgi:hypothetical protein
MTNSEPLWLQLLRTEAGLTSKDAVAKLIGYSRTAISLALKGTYPGGTEKLERKVLATLDPSRVVLCPYERKTIPVELCRELSSRRAPTHNPVQMGQWSACQRCQNKCEGKTK